MEQMPLKAFRDMSESDIRHAFDGIKTGITPQCKSIGFFNDPSQADLLTSMETPTLFVTPTTEETNFFGKSLCETDSATKSTSKNEIKLEPSVEPIHNDPLMHMSETLAHFGPVNSCPQLQSFPTGSLYSKRQAVQTLTDHSFYMKMCCHSPCSSLCFPGHNLSNTTSRSASPQLILHEANTSVYPPSFKHEVDYSPSLCTIKVEDQHSLHASHADPSTKSSKLKPKPLSKRFPCPHCENPRVFARLDELKRHMRTHDNVRPYHCDICQKSFTRSDHLRTHRRTHTGEKPFSCLTCGKGFARSDELGRHKKVHERGGHRASRKSSKFSTPASDSKPPQMPVAAQLCPTSVPLCPHSLPSPQTMYSSASSNFEPLHLSHDSLHAVPTLTSSVLLSTRPYSYPAPPS